MNEKIGRRLKLKDLQALIAVAEMGGIGKAADQLNYSQSAVSKAISNLERVLGRRLLERERKGIELTPYGSALVRCGVAVVDELRKGLADIEFLSDPTAGEVRVGCSEPLSAGLMSMVINRFAQTCPRMTFHVAVSNPADIFQQLRARKLDFAITQIVRPISEELEMQTLYDEPVVIVASMQHPSTRKRRIKLADLVAERWVLPPPQSFISTLLANAFHAEGLNTPRSAVTTHSAYWRVMLVASGRFLTIVPAMMLKAGLKQLPIKALPVELCGNRRPVAIVTLKNRTLSPVAQLFIEQTRATAGMIFKL
jgi:DNA-binding transcriptional LysR family regulator